MREAKVFYRDILAGILTETDDGEYVFAYDKLYIENFPNQFLSFSMPVRREELGSGMDTLNYFLQVDKIPF